MLLRFDELYQAVCEGRPAAMTVEAEGTTYVRNFRPQERLILLGGGHIAQPLCRYGADLGFAVTVVDDRPSFANTGRFPEAAEYLLDNDFLAPDAFAANRPGILDIAAEALYRKAGAPGTYISSGDWARRTGIAAGTLPEMLYRFARFNGKAEGQDPAAWYASKDYPKPDSRENSARALAAFLQSAQGKEFVRILQQ